MARFPTPPPMSKEPSPNKSTTRTSIISSASLKSFLEAENDQLIDWIDSLKLRVDKTLAKQHTEVEQLKEAARLQSLRTKYEDTVYLDNFDSLGQLLREPGAKDRNTDPHFQLHQFSGQRPRNFRRQSRPLSHFKSEQARQYQQLNESHYQGQFQTPYQQFQQQREHQDTQSKSKTSQFQEIRDSPYPQSETGHSDDVMEIFSESEEVAVATNSQKYSDFCFEGVNLEEEGDVEDESHDPSSVAVESITRMGVPVELLSHSKIIENETEEVEIENEKEEEYNKDQEDVDVEGRVVSLYHETCSHKIAKPEVFDIEDEDEEDEEGKEHEEHEEHEVFAHQDVYLHVDIERKEYYPSGSHAEHFFNDNFVSSLSNPTYFADLAQAALSTQSAADSENSQADKELYLESASEQPSLELELHGSYVADPEIKVSDLEESDFKILHQVKALDQVQEEDAIEREQEQMERMEEIETEIPPVINYLPIFKTLGEEDPIKTLRKLKKTEKKYHITLNSVAELEASLGDELSSEYSDDLFSSSDYRFYDAKDSEGLQLWFSRELLKDQLLDVHPKRVSDTPALEKPMKPSLIKFGSGSDTSDEVFDDVSEDVSEEVLEEHTLKDPDLHDSTLRGTVEADLENRFSRVWGPEDGLPLHGSNIEDFTVQKRSESQDIKDEESEIQDEALDDKEYEHKAGEANKEHENMEVEEGTNVEQDCLDTSFDIKDDAPQDNEEIASVFTVQEPMEEGDRVIIYDEHTEIDTFDPTISSLIEHAETELKGKASIDNATPDRVFETLGHNVELFGEIVENSGKEVVVEAVETDPKSSETETGPNKADAPHGASNIVPTTISAHHEPEPVFQIEAEEGLEVFGPSSIDEVSTLQSTPVLKKTMNAVEVDSEEKERLQVNSVYIIDAKEDSRSEADDAELSMNAQMKETITLQSSKRHSEDTETPRPFKKLKLVLNSLNWFRLSSELSQPRDNGVEIGDEVHIEETEPTSEFEIEDIEAHLENEEDPDLSSKVTPDESLLRDDSAKEIEEVISNEISDVLAKNILETLPDDVNFQLEPFDIETDFQKVNDSEVLSQESEENITEILETASGMEIEKTTIAEVFKEENVNLNSDKAESVSESIDVEVFHEPEVLVSIESIPVEESNSVEELNECMLEVEEKTIGNDLVETSVFEEVTETEKPVGEPLADKLEENEKSLARSSDLEIPGPENDNSAISIGDLLSESEPKYDRRPGPFGFLHKTLARVLSSYRSNPESNNLELKEEQEQESQQERQDSQADVVVVDIDAAEVDPHEEISFETSKLDEFKKAALEEVEKEVDVKIAQKLVVDEETGDNEEELDQGIPRKRARILAFPPTDPVLLPSSNMETLLVQTSALEHNILYPMISLQPLMSPVRLTRSQRKKLKQIDAEVNEKEKEGKDQNDQGIENLGKKKNESPFLSGSPAINSSLRRSQLMSSGDDKDTRSTEKMEEDHEVEDNRTKSATPSLGSPITPRSTRSLRSGRTLQTPKTPESSKMRKVASSPKLAKNFRPTRFLRRTPGRASRRQAEQQETEEEPEKEPKKQPNEKKKKELYEEPEKSPDSSDEPISVRVKRAVASHSHHIKFEPEPEAGSPKAKEADSPQKKRLCVSRSQKEFGKLKTASSPTEAHASSRISSGKWQLELTDHPALRTRSKSPIKQSIQELSSEIEEEPLKKTRITRSVRKRLDQLEDKEHKDDHKDDHKEDEPRGRSRYRK